jgi:pimeloyl-ACP methyl ester carboxylesterase
MHRTARGTAWRRRGSGPALVLLHGGAGSWTHWIRNIDALAAHYTLWIPDLPGMGDSAMVPEPRDHHAIATVLAADVDELMPDAGTMDLVGFSFGGVVGAFLAGLRRARFRKLVVVGAGGLGLREKSERILKPWKNLKDPVARAAALRYNFARLMLSKDERVDEEAMALYTADVMRTRVNSARSSRTDELKRKLAELRMPVHGIWGRQDVTARAKFDEIRAILTSSYPQAQLRVIEDAGHWAQYEQAAAFNATLLGLLRDA